MTTAADTDLIACVYPWYDGNSQDAVEAIELPENLKRYIAGPKRQESPEEPEPEQDNRARLELRFSHGPKTPLGFIFGRDKGCDIVLPNSRGASSHHFALTFDELYRPIVRDIGTLTGTQVTYNNDGEGWRRNFNWIVGGNKNPRDRTPIVVHVNKHLKFHLVLSHHDTTSQLYMDNVERFRRGTADGEDLFNRLKLPVDTECATGTQTPGIGAIFLKKTLGEGSFGVVTHFWDVSTAKEFALKQPPDALIKRKEVDVLEWAKEAEIMDRINHENVVKLVKTELDPWPKLYLEYVPGGSLENHMDLSMGECKQVLHQLLSALDHMHGLNPPILHRDIKPANILVQYRHAGRIQVKFGDFGISGERRESSQWKTVCGTLRYIAPEMFVMMRDCILTGRTDQRYTAAVDIWSLGIVMFKLVCGIPPYKAEYEYQGTHWAETILEKLGKDLSREPSDLLQFLSTAMLIIEPESRCSAKMCLDGVRSLSDETDAALQTSMPVPRLEDDQAATLRIPQTAIFQGTVVPSLIRESIESADVARQAASSHKAPPSSRQWRLDPLSRPSRLSTITRRGRTRHGSFVEPGEPASQGNTAGQSGGQPVEQPPCHLEPPYPGGEDTFSGGTDLGAQGAYDEETDLAALRLAYRR
ncbi:kinase-like protein [Trichoderma austrokoningii]